jgi:rhodanese-related sulfurtransferase
MSAVEVPRKPVPPPLELVKSRIEELLPPDAHARLERGEALLVDVRDRDRFGLGRIEGAVNVPSGESGRDARSSEYAQAIAAAIDGDRGRALIVYCGEGNRSARTVDALRNEHGFAKAASIIGGIKLWRDLGFEVEGELADEGDDQEAQE